MTDDRPETAGRGDNAADPVVPDHAAARGSAVPGAPAGADPEETDLGRNQTEGLTTPGGVDGGSAEGSVAEEEQPPRAHREG